MGSLNHSTKVFATVPHSGPLLGAARGGSLPLAFVWCGVVLVLTIFPNLIEVKENRKKIDHLYSKEGGGFTMHYCARDPQQSLEYQCVCFSRFSWSSIKFAKCRGQKLVQRRG